MALNEKKEELRNCVRHKGWNRGVSIDHRVAVKFTFLLQAGSRFPHGVDVVKRLVVSQRRKTSSSDCPTWTATYSNVEHDKLSLLVGAPFELNSQRIAPVVRCFLLFCLSITF